MFGFRFSLSRRHVVKPGASHGTTALKFNVTPDSQYVPLVFRRF